MNRKLPLSLTGITMAFPVCGVLAQSNSGQVKRPMNIVYIMSDDHSYQTISAYDKRFINTPNLDWIADHGVRFTNSYVANSLSGPSRACMLTGKHSHANGFTDNTKTFDGGQQTFPKLLQKAGYETAIIGKWHLTSDPTGFNYWDILIGQGDYYNPDFKCNGQQLCRRDQSRDRSGARLARKQTRQDQTFLSVTAQQGATSCLGSRHLRPGSLFGKDLSHSQYIL